MSEIYCPYCGYEMDGSFLDEPDENLPWECDDCKKNFRVDAEAEIVLYSYPERTYLDRSRRALEEHQRWFEENKERLVGDPIGLRNLKRQLASHKNKVAKAEARAKENGELDT